VSEKKKGTKLYHLVILQIFAYIRPALKIGSRESGVGSRERELRELRELRKQREIEFTSDS